MSPNRGARVTDEAKKRGKVALRTMTSPRVSMLIAFLSDDLALSSNEWNELHALIEAKIRRKGLAPASSTAPRTLYLPREPLDEL